MSNSYEIETKNTGKIDRYKAELDWINVLFLYGSPFLAVGFLGLYFYLEKFNWLFILLFLAFYIASGIAITGGYHRLYAHRTYKASKVLELFYLLFGAAAVQNSAVFWADDHRRHHLFVDTDNDPYNAKQGLWFSHIGWILYKDSFKERSLDHVPDLAKNELVMWQHRNYWILAILMGFGLPTLIGWAMGSALGGFVFGGLLRIVVVHHFIFCINSLAHYWGAQTYSDENTARDNSILALFTYGEGYHNFHHVFEADYRNGVRWFNFDPTKWFIGFMAWVGLAADLKRVPDTIILRARLNMDKKRLKENSPVFFASVNESLDRLQAQLIEIRQRIYELHAQIRTLKKQFDIRYEQRLLEIKSEIRAAKKEFRLALAQLRATTSMA